MTLQITDYAFEVDSVLVVCVDVLLQSVTGLVSASSASGMIAEALLLRRLLLSLEGPVVVAAVVVVLNVVRVVATVLGNLKWREGGNWINHQNGKDNPIGLIFV